MAFLYLIHWFLIFFPVWVPILYVKHESRSRLTKTEDGAPAWKLRDQIWWTAVQWFYAINGSCEKDQKERCSRVPMVMLCLVTNFKLLQVKCIVKFRCRVGDCNCVKTSKESHHSVQVSDLLSELKARREQVGQRNLGSEAQKHHWAMTAWLCDGWNPVPVDMSFKIIPLSMGFDAWKLSDFHQQQDNLSALKECSAFLGNPVLFVCMKTCGIEFFHVDSAMHTGPEAIEMVHSGEGDPAQVRELTEDSCSCDGHPLLLWFPEWAFKRKSGLATVSKCVMRSPSVWNGFKTGGICLSKPKQYYFFSKTEQTCSCQILGICSFETSISGHGIGDWNLGTCGQRKERRGAVRMLR